MSLFLSPSSRRRITSPPSSKLYPRKGTVWGTRPPLGRHVTVTQSGDISPENTGAAEYTVHCHDNCAVLKFLLSATSPLLLVQQLRWQFRVAAPYSVVMSAWTLSSDTSPENTGTYRVLHTAYWIGMNRYSTPSSFPWLFYTRLKFFTIGFCCFQFEHLLAGFTRPNMRSVCELCFDLAWFVSEQNSSQSQSTFLMSSESGNIPTY